METLTSSFPFAAAKVAMVMLLSRLRVEYFNNFLQLRFCDLGDL
jgi:hypothetical protein